MKFIEKHSKILAVALCLCASGPILSTVYAYETQPGWHGEDADRYYVLEDSRQRATGLTEIDDEVYYFNGQGEMQFGWQNISNKTYYFGLDGAAVSGEQTIQGTTYNFQQEGGLKQGWNEEDQCYYDEKGFKTTNAWIDQDGVRYYYDENGGRVTGWQDIDGQRYYFDENGAMVIGQFEVDGQTYTTGDDGAFRTGWVEQDGVKNYYNADGTKVVNTVQDIDGSKYGFDESGNLILNSEKDGYTFDENGVGTEVTVPETPVETPVAPAEPVETPVQPETPVETPVEPEAPVETPVAPAEPVETPVQPEAPVETPVQNNDKASAIYAAAMAQLGVNQDCTMLVTNSLASVGISFHGWPQDYAALGSWTDAPVPGDIIIYSGHVAIYAGGGQAVHGGWLGYQTVLSSVVCTNTLIGYIHVA